ncbi:hypothetical protein P8452_70017 [Trifolium repens]|nr:hypothetical protein P8452_70017 [Trifolium repens]
MGKPLNDEEQTVTKKNKTNQNQKKNISKVQKIKSTIDLESLCLSLLSSQIKIMTILESLDLESLSLSLDLSFVAIPSLEFVQAVCGFEFVQVVLDFMGSCNSFKSSRIRFVIMHC